MEYVFGAPGSFEVLKTKGSVHTDFDGFHIIEQVYPDQTITDHFRIVRKLDSKEDVEGNCYDWYEIDSHYRTVDKSVPLLLRIEESKSAMEDVLCEEDTTIAARISAIENAICEMDSAMNQ